MAETSKKRTVRIPLDYYKRRDRLASWRLILSALAVVTAGAWASGIGWDFWSASGREARARRLATHGPLARPHATWDAQCEACHVPFRPIGLSTWARPVLGDSSRSDALCQGCHAAPIHHASQSTGDIACATCHHDHRGRDASLVRMADQHCTRCHADLTAHMSVDRAPAVAETVTRFDSDLAHHPEFRSGKRSDPGRLKFNHALHLTPGMASEQGGPVQTLKMLREADRARYQEYAQGPEQTIRLDCAACHRLDAGAGPSPSRMVPAGGAYMLPVTYEKDCRACHRLDYDPASPSLEMSHPLQPAEVHRTLWQVYGAEFLEQDPALLNQKIPPWPLPGRETSPEPTEARRAIERKVGDAEKILFGARKCGECHQYETKAGESFASLGAWDPSHEVRTASTDVPAVWWRGAAFDHGAHRGVSCRGCHERAFPDAAGASRVSKDVLLPSRETCLECHSPRHAGPEAGTMIGGAGFDCTECHRYHGGDASLLGLAPTPVDVDSRLPIRQFLLGAPTSKGH